MDNNNKQLFARLYGVAIVLILSVLSLSVQAQAIPTIVYSLAPPPLSSDITTDSLGAYSIREGGTAEGTTATFILTRESPYTTPTNVIVSITRTSDSNDPADPDNFVVTVDGSTLTVTNSESSVMITFAAGDNAKTISFSFTGNDALNDNYVYSIRIAPANVPPGDDEEIITFTIRDDEDDIPPTLPGNNKIVADPGATQVALEFYSAYDTIGSVADSSGRTYTRNVNYVITFTRMASDDSDKPALTLPSITVSAARAIVSETGLGLDTAEIFTSRPSPAFLLIRILLTRNDAVLTPGDSYMANISIIDRENNPGDADPSIEYERALFTMLRDVHAELALAGVDCGTDLDSDRDGVSSAYELHIGTDCNSGVDDYIGPTAPVLVATITFPSPPPGGDARVVPAVASIYTQIQIDTGVMCEPATDDESTPEDESIGCANLKAFIVSSGLSGNASDDAVAMVTGICPDPDADIPSVPNSCWVDDVSVDSDGNVLTEIPLQLGYNLIDWVAADTNGNLVLSTRQKQLVYVAPGVVLFNGTTDLVLPEGETEGEGSFQVEFVQPEDDSDVTMFDTIIFIGPETRTISDNVSPTISFSSSSCDSAISVSSLLLSAEGAYKYKYTYTGTEDATCSFDALTRTSPVMFGVEPDPFYFAGNGINVVRASTTNRVARASIDEIEVTTSNTNTVVAAITSNENYRYSVTTLPTNEDVIVGIRLISPLDGTDEVVTNGDRDPAGTGNFSLSSVVPEPSDGSYISIKATIAGTSITHTVDYPILPAGTASLADSDNDGVPNNSVSIPTFDRILLSNRSDVSLFTAILVPNGYRVTLGNIARRNGENDPENNPAQAQLGQMRGDPLIPDSDGLPGNYNNEGVFEFDVYLPANTNTAFISIPLATERIELTGLTTNPGLNENKGYVKYTTDGGWKNFIPSTSTSTGDTYYSAPGFFNSAADRYECPEPMNPSSGITQWGNQRNILLKGHRCVLLVITDQGPNDNDGELNGIIVDPGAPGGLPGGLPGGTIRGARGGGGATDLWFLLMLLGLIAVPVLTRQRKRLTR